jgi:triosephosphate isomerase
MPRRFLIVGNWKANPLSKEIALAIINVLNSMKLTEPADIVLAASPIYLPLLRDNLRPEWAVAAQNIYPKASGAYTGEITPPMLTAFGVTWTLIGQYERRSIFKETAEFLAEKVTAALEAGIKVIFCCGEPLGAREGGRAIAYVTRQLDSFFPAVPQGKWADVVIAYEPVWAYRGFAVKEDAQIMAKAIRNLVSTKVSPAVAGIIRIVFGGTVRPEIANEFAAQPDIDGFLVGALSLTSGIAELAKAANSSK